MDYKILEKRLRAAGDILTSDSVSRSTFDSLGSLLSGINPHIDKTLRELTKAWKQVEQVQKGDVIELTLQALPEATPEEKRRKKYILLFLKFWNDLKTEVRRVEKELQKDQAQYISTKGTAWGNIFAATKGPLGVITLIAAGIVLLQMTQVSVIVQNQGCSPLVLSSYAIRLPGLELPKDAIPNGGQVTIKVPPLTVRVEMESSIKVQMYGLTYTFPSTSGVSIIFDGEMLNGKTTRLDLGNQKTHTLSIAC